MSDKKVTDRDYLFLCSLLRAREANMLTSKKLRQMLSAGSFAEVARSLAELGWPEFAGMNRGEIEAALTARREALFDEVGRVVPDKALVELFRVRYDYHNAKTIVKGEAAGAQTDTLLSGAGRVPRERLEEAFREDDYRFVPLTLGHAMSEAKNILARTDNPQLSDFTLDAACYAEMRAMAQTLDNPYISGYVRLLIDGANLRSAVRCARMGRDVEFLKSALLPGGSISTERIAAAYGAGEGVSAVFAASAYRDAALLGAEAAKGGHMTAFELTCDNTVNRYLSDARRMSFGPEAVAGHLAEEESNLAAVRMVLTGLLSGIPADKLKERLRDTYV